MAYKSKHLPVIQRYIADVLSGERVAGELEQAAVRRHLDDLQQAGQRGYYFDMEPVDQVLDFMELQKQSTGEFSGKPFLLFPYQKFMVAMIFGWRRREDGLRRFRKFYYSVGRGNGKSPFAALLMLVLICYDQPIEPRAELVLAATERAQTRHVYGEIRRMIEQQEALAEIFEIKRDIIIMDDESSIERLGKEAKSKDGMILHAFVADELHEWREEHREVLDKLQTSMGKRRQPLEVLITTAGSDRSVVWKEVYHDAVKVARQIIENDTWLVCIFQMDEGDDCFEESVWPKANPNLDVSVKRVYLRGLADEARHNAVKLNQFLRYHMNVEVRSLVKVIDRNLWLDSQVSLSDEELAGKPCCLGLDLGWRDDLASLTACFELGTKENRLFALKSWNFICEDTPKRDLTQPPWNGWVRDGHLIVTEGNATDPQAIYNKIAELRELYHVRTVALDPNNARAIGLHLVNDMGMVVFDFNQTCKKYHEPTVTLLSLLEDGRLVHDGNPVLSWAADNLVLKTDASGKVMPDKSKAVDKIDPMVAGIMALSECLFDEEGESGGYNNYEFKVY